MWPTPSSRDGKGGYLGGRIRNGKVSWDTLDVAVQYVSNPDKTGGPTEPNVGRLAHGVPARLAQLRGLGNAIVPQCATVLYEEIARREGLI
jgi:hypothetical protein